MYSGFWVGYPLENRAMLKQYVCWRGKIIENALNFSCRFFDWFQILLHITKFDINLIGLIIYFILRRLLFEEKQHLGDYRLTGRFAKKFNLTNLPCEVNISGGKLWIKMTLLFVWNKKAITEKPKILSDRCYRWIYSAWVVYGWRARSGRIWQNFWI